MKEKYLVLIRSFKKRFQMLKIYDQWRAKDNLQESDYTTKLKKD